METHVYGIHTPGQCIRLSYFVNLLCAVAYFYFVRSFVRPANRAIESGSQSPISAYANYTLVDLLPCIVSYYFFVVSLVSLAVLCAAHFFRFSSLRL